MTRMPCVSIAGRVATGLVITDQIRLCRGQIVIGHLAPTAKGGNRSAEVVPLVVRLGLLQVQPGSVASGVVS